MGDKRKSTVARDIYKQILTNNVISDINIVGKWRREISFS